MTIEEKESSFRETQSLNQESLPHYNLNSPESRKILKERDYNTINPKFLKNSQRIDVIKDTYPELLNKTIDKKHEKTLEQHIDSKSININNKFYNKSMDEKTYKYVQNVNDAYREMLGKFPDQAMEIYNSRLNFKDKNTFYHSNAFISLIKQEARENKIENLHNLLNSNEIQDNKLKLVKRAVNDLLKEKDNNSIDKIIANLSEEDAMSLKDFITQTLSHSFEVKEAAAKLLEDPKTSNETIPCIKKVDGLQL